jgi:hypothetical protein
MRKLKLHQTTSEVRVQDSLFGCKAPWETDAMTVPGGLKEHTAICVTQLKKIFGSEFYFV